MIDVWQSHRGPIKIKDMKLSHLLNALAWCVKEKQNDTSEYAALFNEARLRGFFPNEKEIIMTETRPLKYKPFSALANLSVEARKEFSRKAGIASGKARRAKSAARLQQMQQELKQKKEENEMKKIRKEDLKQHTKKLSIDQMESLLERLKEEIRAAKENQLSPPDPVEWKAQILSLFESGLPLTLSEAVEKAKTELDLKIDPRQMRGWLGSAVGFGIMGMDKAKRFHLLGSASIAMPAMDEEEDEIEDDDTEEVLSHSHAPAVSSRLKGKSASKPPVIKPPKTRRGAWRKLADAILSNGTPHDTTSLISALRKQHGIFVSRRKVHNYLWELNKSGLVKRLRLGLYQIADKLQPDSKTPSASQLQLNV